jgi:hypothetical protein
MKFALIAVLLLLAGFGAGWFTHKQTQSNCYVLPAYTDPGSGNDLLPDSGPSVNPPELVCK